MRYLIGAVTGLAVSVLLLMALTEIDVIEIGPMASDRGQWLVVPLLLACPTVGVMLGSAPKVRRLGIALGSACILLVAVMSAEQVAVRVSGLVFRTRSGGWQQEAVIAAREAFGSSTANAYAGIRIPGCAGLLVMATDGARRVWYWYDGREKNLVAELTEAQLQQGLRRFLPEGARLSAFATGENPHGVDFAYSTAKGTYTAAATIGQNCNGFTLDELVLNEPSASFRKILTPGVKLP